MHIAFVDESGDVGLRNSPTRHFVLCATLVNHIHWADVNRELLAMRQRLLATHGLRLEAEIHASEFLGGSPSHLGLNFRRRFECTLHVLRTLGALPGTAFVRIAAAKTTDRDDVLEIAWSGLLSELGRQAHLGEPQACPSSGLLVISDYHGSLPYRPTVAQLAGMTPGLELLDLPFGRDSKDNLALQASDLLAYLTKQSIEPGIHFSRSRGRALVRASDRLFSGPCRLIGP